MTDHRFVLGCLAIVLLVPAPALAGHGPCHGNGAHACPPPEPAPEPSDCTLAARVPTPSLGIPSISLLPIGVKPAWPPVTFTWSERCILA